MLNTIIIVFIFLDLLQLFSFFFRLSCLYIFSLLLFYFSLHILLKIFLIFIFVFILFECYKIMLPIFVSIPPLFLFSVSIVSMLLHSFYYLYHFYSRSLISLSSSVVLSDSLFNFLSFFFFFQIPFSFHSHSQYI